MFISGVVSVRGSRAIAEEVRKNGGREGFDMIRRVA